MKVAAYLAWCVALVLLGTACRSRPSRVDGVVRAGSEARHNAQLLAGPRFVWRNGAYAQVLAGRRERIEEPSTRGDSAEWMVEAEASWPLWGRR